MLSTVRVAKCQKQSRDGRRRASSTPRRLLFAQDDDEVFVTGSMLYTGQEVKPPPSQCRRIMFRAPHVGGIYEVNQQQHISILNTESAELQCQINANLKKFNRKTH